MNTIASFIHNLTNSINEPEITIDFSDLNFSSPLAALIAGCQIRRFVKILEHRMKK